MRRGEINAQPTGSLAGLVGRPPQASRSTLALLPPGWSQQSWMTSFLQFFKAKACTAPRPATNSLSCPPQASPCFLSPSRASALAILSASQALLAIWLRVFFITAEVGCPVRALPVDALSPVPPGLLAGTRDISRCWTLSPRPEHRITTDYTPWPRGSRRSFRWLVFSTAKAPEAPMAAHSTLYLDPASSSWAAPLSSIATIVI